MTKRIIYISIVFIFSSSVFAQNLDSLFNAYVNRHSESSSIKNPSSIQAHSHDNKCGFSTIGVLQENFERLSPEQQVVLNNMMARPNRQTSIVSPSGFFRIHYDTTGTHVPDYYPNSGLSQAQSIKKSVDSLAAAFDFSFNYEVNFLGYDAPETDNSEGGDGLYDIYISDNIGVYGETKFTTGSPESYIMIENDFTEGFATTAIHAAKVTAAHEFHHAIQISSFGFFSSETTFYEMVSTAMEEFVYDYVNDYYAYIPRYFNNPSRSFKENNGYDIGIFYLYLQQKSEKENNPVSGHDVIKRTWEVLAENGKCIEALSTAMFEYGMDLPEVWNEFGIWSWFTGNRPATSTYFEESEFYPQIKPMASYEFTFGKKEYMFNTKPLSNNFVVFEIPSTNFNDSLLCIITNGDLNNAVSSPYVTTDVNYTISTNSSDGSKIVNDYYSKIDAPNSNLFLESNLFNNELVSGGTITREVVDFTFPQPFIYSQHSSLFIPAEPNSLEFADLNIYTTSMDLVYSGRERIIIGNKIVVRWDAMDSDGKKLPTGVYIYVTKSGDDIRKGKFVIYND